MAALGKLSWQKIANDSSGPSNSCSNRLVLLSGERAEAIDCDFGCALSVQAVSDQRSAKGELTLVKAENVPDSVFATCLYVKRQGCFFHSSEMHENAELVHKQGYTAPALQQAEHEPSMTWHPVTYYRLIHIPKDSSGVECDRQLLVPVAGTQTRYLWSDPQGVKYLVRDDNELHGSLRRVIKEKVVHEVAVSVAVHKHSTSSGVQPAVQAMTSQLARYNAPDGRRFYRVMLGVQYAAEGAVSYDLTSYSHAVDGRLMLGTAAKEVYRGRLLKHSEHGYCTVNAVKVVVKIVGCKAADAQHPAGPVPLQRLELRRAGSDDMRHEVSTMASICALLPPDHAPVMNAVLTDLSAASEHCNLFLSLPYFPRLSVQAHLNQKKMGDTSAMRESLARFVVHDVAEGLLRLHGIGAVHLDISPENIVINEAHRCVIIDYGQARVGPDCAMHLAAIGTKAFFHSPQWVGCWLHGSDALLQWDELVKLDAWYLGILLFILLCRTAPGPFALLLQDEVPLGVAPAELSDSNKKTFRWLNNKDRVLAAMKDRKLFSEEATDLLIGLLHSDPSKRLDMAAVLAHPWITALSEESRLESFGEVDLTTGMKRQSGTAGTATKTQQRHR